MVEIGPIGDVSYMKEMTVSNEQLFGRPVVLVSGLCIQNGRGPHRIHEIEAGWTADRIERYRYSSDGNTLLPEGR
ncbi:hypothetical protein [Paenibacillus lupini]|uniref:hypothetical protein n=1 Tax=Paenibacillus lupini TaxID=1450204 RepID=UPI001421FEAB|nr:hypothetical protein [Paenibacillus lupini]NIK25800.1 hypothetical protein [Paenibacillus lupini]